MDEDQRRNGQGGSEKSGRARLQAESVVGMRREGSVVPLRLSSSCRISVVAVREMARVGREDPGTPEVGSSTWEALGGKGWFEWG